MSESVLNKHNLPHEYLGHVFSKHFKEYNYNEIIKFTDNFKHVLGKGAYGNVYKGKINNLNVAIKKYNSESVEPFLRELSNILRCKHPNILSIYGICYEQDVCLVLEYMAKGSLQDYLDKKDGCIKLDKLKILDTLVELSETLAYLHADQFWYRDIKPGNILFDDYGKAKFSNFNHAVFYNDTEIVQKDPSIVKDKENGCFLDIYSFGITMLVLLSEERDMFGIYSRANGIFQSQDKEALKKFFKKDWGDQMRMDLLKCAMECTKYNKRDRIEASAMAEILKCYRNRLSSNVPDFERCTDEIKRLNLERAEIYQQYQEIGRKYINLNSDYSKLKDIVEKKEKDNKKLEYEISVLKEKVKKDDGQVQSESSTTGSLTELSSRSIQQQQLSPRDDKEMHIIIHLRNNTYTSDLLNILKVRRTVTKMLTSLTMAKKEAEEPLIVEESKCVHKILDTEKLLSEINYVLKICSKISFCNINIWHISENVIIENDIVIESNTRTLMNFNTENYIKIKGDIKVELNNFHVINCRNYKENPFIEICDKGNMMIQNGLFINNIGLKSLIEVKKECKLEIINTDFEGNENSDENYGSCINTSSQSNLKLKKCNFINHRGGRSGGGGGSSGLNATDKNSVCIIGSEGNATIKQCNFKNNINGALMVSSICFDGESSEITISDSLFKQCSSIMFSNNVKATLTDCSFEQNGSKNYNGGALDISKNARVYMSRCNCNYNIAQNGGSIICHDDSKISMKLCLFNGNRAKIGDGGALCLSDHSYIKMDSCSFKENSAAEGNGGAISLTCDSKATIKECDFEDNFCVSNKGNNIYCKDKAYIKEMADNQFIGYDSAYDEKSFFHDRDDGDDEQ